MWCFPALGSPSPAEWISLMLQSEPMFQKGEYLDPFLGPGSPCLCLSQPRTPGSWCYQFWEWDRGGKLV